LKTPKGDRIGGLIYDVIGVPLDDLDALLKFNNWPSWSIETQFSAWNRNSPQMTARLELLNFPLIGERFVFPIIPPIGEKTTNGGALTEERIFDGREMTQSELDTIRRIIDEVNVEIIIEDGDIVIQATCDNGAVEPIARCDLRRVVAYSAGVAAQEKGETAVHALAGLFSKCAQVVLNESEPRYAEREESENIGGVVRLFASNDRAALDLCDDLSRF
jgi:hypothetical protein